MFSVTLIVIILRGSLSLFLSSFEKRPALSRSDTMTKLEDTVPRRSSISYPFSTRSSSLFLPGLCEILRSKSAKAWFCLEYSIVDKTEKPVTQSFILSLLMQKKGRLPFESTINYHRIGEITAIESTTNCHRTQRIPSDHGHPTCEPTSHHSEDSGPESALQGTLGLIWCVKAPAPWGIIDCVGCGPFFSVCRSSSFSSYPVSLLWAFSLCLQAL